MKAKRILAGFVAVAMTMGMMSSLVLADEAENTPKETSVVETTEPKEKETKKPEENKPAETKEADPEPEKKPAETTETEPAQPSEKEPAESKEEEPSMPAQTEPEQSSVPTEEKVPEATVAPERGGKADTHSVPSKNEQESLVTISSFTATSNIESILAYGNPIKEPTLSITAGQPARGQRFTWQKYNESNGKWVSVSSSETFTDGRWRCTFQIYMRVSDYVLDSNGITVTIDGVVWKHINDYEVATTPIIPSVYPPKPDETLYISYAWATSPEFTIEEPVGVPLTLKDGFDSINIPASRVGTAINTIDISEYVLGGKKPYVFSKISGPDWISVSEAGVISGTPTAAETNADLNIKVTDAKGGIIIDDIPVGKTYLSKEDCAKVSEVIATCNIDSLPVLGGTIEAPSFNITVGQPAFVSGKSVIWLKYDEATGKWNKISTPAAFTEGKWRCRIPIRIEEPECILDPKGVTVTVNGVVWPTILDNEESVTPIIPQIIMSNNGPEFISNIYATSPEYTITKKAINPEVILSATEYTYNGQVQQPTVVVSDGSNVLDASQYEVTYSSGCKNVGTYKVFINLKGNYSGSETLTFKINPKGTKLSKLKKAKKAVNVKWKKQSGKMSASRISGYQIQVATDSTFTKNKKTVNVKGYKKTSKKVSKLKGGKKYWVRIRTYKKVGNVTYYSPWSAVKTVKTKK